MWLLLAEISVAWSSLVKLREVCYEKTDPSDSLAQGWAVQAPRVGWKHLACQGLFCWPGGHLSLCFQKLRMSPLALQPADASVLISEPCAYSVLSRLCGFFRTNALGS